MSSVISDLRYAAREMRRRPGFALTAILSLALGIGATSAVFSVVYGVRLNRATGGVSFTGQYTAVGNPSLSFLDLA
jgi:hypothetical protein